MYAYPEKTRTKVFKLSTMGYTYGEISKKTKVSPATIFNWVKESRIAKGKTKTAKVARRKARK